MENKVTGQQQVFEKYLRKIIYALTRKSYV